MDAVDHREGLALERLRRGDVRGDHEVLDHAVSIEPFAHGDLGDAALLVEHDASFWQFQLERIARLAGLEERAPGGPEVLQVPIRVARVDPRLRVLVGDDFGDAEERAGEAPVLDAAVLVDSQVAGHRGAVFALAERTDVGAQDLRQHRHDAVGEVDRVAALACFSVDLAVGADVEADIGNGDDRVEAAFAVGLGPDGVVVVARVGRVDGDDRQVAQVLAVILAERQLRGELGFGERLLAEHVRDAVLVDGDQAEGLGRERIAEDFEDLDAGARRAAGLGEDELARCRAAEIGDRRGIAHALVGRGEPGLAAAVELDDAEQAFAARG